MRTIYFFILLAVAIWGLRFCSPGNHSNIQPDEVHQVTLEELNAHIDALKGTPVLVSGTVTETFYIEIADGGFYIIEDGSGHQLTVTTRHRVTPAIGKVVAVIIIPKVLARTNAGTVVTAAEYRQITLEPAYEGDFDDNEEYEYEADTIYFDNDDFL